MFFNASEKKKRFIEGDFQQVDYEYFVKKNKDIFS